MRLQKIYLLRLKMKLRVEKEDTVNYLEGEEITNEDLKLMGDIQTNEYLVFDSETMEFKIKEIMWWYRKY